MTNKRMGIVETGKKNKLHRVYGMKNSIQFQLSGIRVQFVISAREKRLRAYIV